MKTLKEAISNYWQLKSPFRRLSGNTFIFQEISFNSVVHVKKVLPVEITFKGRSLNLNIRTGN